MKIEAVLNDFEPVGLHGANSPAAHSRFDTKYILPATNVPALLQNLKPHFSVLEINGKRQHYYETLYFDTKDYKLYLDHHNGKLNRMKVRLRHYATTDEVFFEVKHKLRSLQTGKLRLPRQKMMFELSQQEWDAIRTRDKQIHGLEKKLITTFTRITLNGKTTDERITIDTNLCFDNFKDKKCLPEICIVEVKHPNLKLSEIFKSAFAAFHTRETAFSKYAIGVALLESSVKKNLFKPTILQLQKTIHGLS